MHILETTLMQPETRPVRRSRGAVLLLIGIVTAALLATAAPQVSAASTTNARGLSALLASHSTSDVVRGIAVFSAIPSASQANALNSLGLTVQPMKKVRLALVAGPVSAMQRAVTSGIALDVYPDRSIELLDTKSANAMGTASLRAAGWTGKGVTVGVVDSGCDASHPDLANQVVHNVTLASAEYANIHPNGDNTVIVAQETGPYKNTDIGGGHGTHVAGIIAADSSSAADGSRLGVAPDAKLACFAIGLVLFTSAVVTAYDVMLRQPDLWGIDVVNNSWGNSFRQYDPNDPVHVVTAAVTAHGVTVVFAAGNSGNDEMSLNPFSEAPWIISVGAGTISHALSDFSSTGLIHDNSVAGYIGAGGHTVYTGDRIGVYHPDVVAPGSSISSTCTPAGTVVAPCTPNGNGTASGTSMASPHVAGAVALLLQANPRLTPQQVRLALQATAVPIVAAGKPLPFWQQGYGYVDLAKAVKLVRSSGWKDKLAAASRAADKRVLAYDGYKVVRSDLYTYAAPRASVAGTTDERSYTVNVPSTVKFLKATLSHPSTTVLTGNNMFYDVTVKDAAGAVVGTGTEVASAGTTTVFIDLAKVSPKVKYGNFTIETSGFLAVSDPDTFDSDSLLGRMITLQIAQVVAGK
jgi:serine protease AprX